MYPQIALGTIFGNHFLRFVTMVCSFWISFSSEWKQNKLISKSWSSKTTLTCSHKTKQSLHGDDGQKYILFETWLLKVQRDATFRCTSLATGRNFSKLWVIFNAGFVPSFPLMYKSELRNRNFFKTQKTTRWRTSFSNLQSSEASHLAKKDQCLT